MDFFEAFSAINIRFLIDGLRVTVEVSILSILFSFIIGGIAGILRFSSIPVFSKVLGVVIDVIRNLPLLLIIFFTYFALPQIGIRFNIFWSAVVALTIFESAMLSEIFRAGLNSVPKGQMEASRSLGMTYTRTMQKIILPQAIKIMIPSFVNQFVISLKDTTIISVIGVVELLQTGKIIVARTTQSTYVYLIIAIIYLVVITALTKLAKVLEKKVK